MKKVILIFGFFPLMLLSVLMVTKELQAQVIVPDFQVANVSDAGAPVCAVVDVDEAYNFTIAYAFRYFLPRQPIGPIVGRQFNESGIMQGEEFIISENNTTGIASIDMNSSGNFIVCWGGSTVYFQMFNNDHMAQDSNSVVGPGGYNAAVAIDDARNFVIAWEHSDTIYCQQYNMFGKPLGKINKVSNNPNSTRSSSPKIDIDGSGNFIIVWQNIGYDFIHSYYRRYDNKGEPQGNNIKINGDTIDSNQSSPVVCTCKNGNFIVGWTDDLNGDYDIYFHLYNSSGEPQGNTIQVNDDTNNSYQSSPVIDVDESGEIIITWKDNRNGNWDIYAQRYNSNGEAIGINFQINQIEDGDQEYPDVALQNGRIYSTWQIYNGSSNDGIWANVLDFSNPVYVDPGKESEQVPAQFKLNQNYPNPFNPTTTIQYTLKEDCQVSLKIYNLTGQEVRTLVNEYQTAGSKAVLWDGRNSAQHQAASGIYIYKIVAADFTEYKKMSLIK